MGKLDEKMKKELRLLFHALCDGLRQEVRQRHNLALMIPGYDSSLINEREIGVTSSLAWHLRLAGFVVQIDTYVKDGDSKRRPDFGIWLPDSQKYIYLEFKLAAWGSGFPYDYARAIKDIDKLEHGSDLQNHPNGLIALGFSNPDKRKEQLLEGFKKFLSERITRDYPHYEQIGLESVDFQEMDAKTPHAVIGLWFRKEWNDS